MPLQPSEGKFEWPKDSLTIAIPDRVYEHLRSCPASTLKQCIQHLGLDVSSKERDHAEASQ
jgi:hypothetical protein